MSDDQRQVSITVQATQAINSLKQVGAGLSSMNSLIGQSDKQLQNTETRLQTYGQKIAAAAEQVNQLKQSNKDLAAAVQSANKVLAAQSSEIAASNASVNTAKNTIAQMNGTSQTFGKTITDNQTKLLGNAAAFDKNATAISGFKTNLLSANTSAMQTKNSVSSLIGSMNLPGLTTASGKWDQQTESLNRLTGSFRTLTPQAVQWSDASTKSLASTKDWAGAASDFTQQNVALRYALYSVATTFGIMTAAGVKAYSDLFSAGIDFQKNIAGVLRTSQVESPSQFSASPLVLSGIITQEQQAQLATQSLTSAFLNLQASIPISQEDLTTIGTLGSQMGIDAQDIVEFTKTVAEFSAATGIDASTSATGIARIVQLLPDLKGNYSGLASAILKTGVNSIATESQILQSTQNIASVGRVAGLSATQIIALSSGMSSLGITSELQRSTITQSFTKILTAVDEGTDSAAKFGSVLGLTGKQFQDAWGKDPYSVFLKLTDAIASSSNGVQILGDLGLATQRLTPTILKIGQNTSVFAAALKDTQTGLKQNTELTRQFQIIASTTASRLQVLSQAWDKFLTIIGGGAVNLLGGAAKAISDMINNLSVLASTPAGQVISGITIGVGLLVVALLGVTTMVTLAAASFLGLNYVLKLLNIEMVTTDAVTGATSLSFDAAGASALLAAGKTAVLSGSMVALRTGLAALVSPVGIVTAALAAFGLVVSNDAQINSFGRSLDGESNSLKSLAAQLEATTKAGTGWNIGSPAQYGFDSLAKGLDSFDVQFSRSMGTLSSWNPQISQVFGNIRELDENLATFAAKNAPAATTQLESLSKAWVDSGQKQSTFADAFPDTIKALDLATGKTGATAAELAAYNTEQADAASLAQKQAQTLADQGDALGLVTNAYVTAKDASTAYISAVQNAGSGSIDVTTDITNAFGTDKGQGGGLPELQQTLNSQIGAYQTWAAGITELTAKGASATAQAFIAAGPASQKAVSEALQLSPQGLTDLETSMREAAFYASAAYANIFKDQNAVIANVYKQVLAVDPSQAQNALEEVITDLGTHSALTTAQIIQLDQQFGIKLDVSLDPEIIKTGVLKGVAQAQATATAHPVLIPVTTGPTNPFATPTPNNLPAPASSQEYGVTEGTHSILLKVDPDTTEGQKDLDAWRADNYKVPVKIAADVDTNPANLTLAGLRSNIENTLKTIKNDISAFRIPGITVQLNVNKELNANNFRGGLLDSRGVGHYATGGQFRGPGTGTSDSILAAVSNGEYINTAAAVRYYGVGMFDAINRRQFPKFAGGGSVGSVTENSGATVSVSVVQNYPTTQDPIKKLKTDAANVAAGIWN